DRRRDEPVGPNLLRREIAPRMVEAQRELRGETAAGPGILDVAGLVFRADLTGPRTGIHRQLVRDAVLEAVRQPLRVVDDPEQVVDVAVKRTLVPQLEVV